MAERCPNARFNLICPRNDLCEYLSITGKPLEGIGTQYPPGYNAAPSDRASAWILCPNLQKLSLDKIVQLQDPQAVFLTSKFSLEEIHISIRDSKAMYAFASGAVTTRNRKMYQRAMNPVAQQNLWVMLKFDLYIQIQVPGGFF